jgi:two-component system OmpR family sensor kinase
MITDSIRLRMMLLFCAVVGVLLAGSHLGYYALLRREVRSQLDRQLQGAAAPVLRDLISEPNSQDINEFNLVDEYFELIDASGHVLQRSRNLHEWAIGLEGVPRSSSETSCQTIAQGRDSRMRVCSIPFRRGAETFFLIVAMPTQEADRALANFNRVTLVLLPLSLLLTAVISAWYVGRSLRPIADLTAHAARMTKRVSDPLQKDALLLLPVKNPHDELGRLAGTFNELLAHVDSALGQLRQFVSDASHELRTPLSVLQGETELLLGEPGFPAKHGKTLSVIHDELRKLSRIVESLFTLAMADAGQLRLAAEALYLNEVLEETCVLADQLARSKHITIERQLSEEIPYFGDEVFLRELFLIFLENAVKYSPSDTRICVQTYNQNGMVRVRFQDHGIGIPPEHIPRIFERFYRVVQNGGGEARSGGLGLAIAQAIVSAQSGSIECESTPGLGSTFTVYLPNSPNARG